MKYADRVSQLVIFFSLVFMIVQANELTISGAKESFESITQIVNNLSSSPSNASKIRHSLKNLCFYSPTIPAVSPLLELFKHELKDQSKYFKLLCYHLISHASLASSSTQTVNLISTIAKTLNSQKKITKAAPDFFRVFFYLSFFVPMTHNTLIDTIAKIITADLGFLSEKGKKGRSKSLKPSSQNAISDLIYECVKLLVELPNFEELTKSLFQKSGVVDGFVNIYKNFGKEYKLAILGFLSNIKYNSQIVQVPPQLLDIINPEDNIIDNVVTAGYLINHHSKFGPQIQSLLEKKATSTRLIQYKLLSFEDLNSISSIGSLNEPTKAVGNFVMSYIKPQSSSLLPLLKYLEKVPRLESVPVDVQRNLYQACQDSNITVAFLAFQCVCFLSDEMEWISRFFSDSLNQLSLAARKSIGIALCQSWIEALNHSENKKFVCTLFQKFIMEFGNCIDQKIYREFMLKVIETGCSDNFMEIFEEAFEKLPSEESIVFIFYGAAMLKKHTDPTLFARFIDSTNEYLETACPSMIALYENIFSKPVE